MKHYPEELSLNQLVKHMLDELGHFLLHIVNINPMVPIITEFQQYLTQMNITEETVIEAQTVLNTCFSLFRYDELLLIEGISTLL